MSRRPVIHKLSKGTSAGLGRRIQAEMRRTRKCPVAVGLIDIVSHFEFPEGERLLRQARHIAQPIAALKRRAREAGVPVIYINDNFGNWRSDAKHLLRYCLRPSAIGRNFVEQVCPDEEDYFILKPKHSAFYQTPLEVLLQYLGTTTLVLAGVTTNSCILATVQDANMRDFRVVVTSDCCAANTLSKHQSALRLIEGVGKASVRSSRNLRFRKLLEEASHIG